MFKARSLSALAALRLEALAGGVSLVMVIYLLANAAYFWAMPFAAVAHSQHVASDVIASFAGARWTHAITSIALN